MVLRSPLAHSAPIGFVFYNGTQFPAEYRGDAFVAFRGSWNRSVPTGYEVMRVHFANGVPAPAPLSHFLSGFLLDDGAAQFGRLAGLAVDAAGALLVAEDSNGVVYKVSYGAANDGGVVDGPPSTRASRRKHRSLSRSRRPLLAGSRPPDPAVGRSPSAALAARAFLTGDLGSLFTERSAHLRGQLGDSALLPGADRSFLDVALRRSGLLRRGHGSLLGKKAH
jgi:hypothetical protein